MKLEDLALIGNCQISALVQNTGAIVWGCLPRFDSEPVFARLLDENDGGHFTICSASGGTSELCYLTNTNVTETIFTAPDGKFRVIDFAPRFFLHERTFRPTQIIRIIEPLSGTPRVSVNCVPVRGWSKEKPKLVTGSNHVTFEGFASELRLTTDVSLSRLQGEPFVLTEKKHLVLSWGAPVEEALQPLCERFLSETIRYWQRWVKHCNIPPLFQREVIRSALILKLHCYEDTGAIIAAMTTSLPESAHSGRTWDYRYCWLRDAYYALSALRALGHFEEREKFLSFILDIAASQKELQPIYRIDGSPELEEKILPHWPGFEGHGPVRVGNGAATQLQNDIFGETVLALVHIFFDDRFAGDRSPAALKLLTQLTEKAIAVAGTPDAGIWEHRNGHQPRTFSSLMCWAAADSMAFVAQRHAPAREQEFAGAAKRIKDEILQRAWNESLGAFVGTYDSDDFDASLLQLATLRFLPANDPRLLRSLQATQKALAEDHWLFRYRRDDGFGEPKVAFVICSFWLISALCQLGKKQEAQAALHKVLQTASTLGIFAEDFDIAGQRMWGNFPQVYSHVGLIHAAFAASPSWAEML